MSSNDKAGFTMIEVLVALVIVAVALGACMRAAGMMADSSDGLRARTVAGWSAANRLAELRLAATRPAIGSRRFACNQGIVALVCEESVMTTSQARLLLVTVAVYSANDAGTRLAQLAQVMQK
ncbi:hypothetical protein RN01_07120 [Cupriavidus sp. SHE]|jgi:general secretion pathway protein I|uniref:Type II secretion system protein I n=2 Tax=Burkholderiaceae TaxID=119060 RepID=A0A482ILJ6_9BURK|nr:type II secretion system minor pseudopilin GspI [Cupriavidus metallidurans]KWR84270.1 hypothetical protein RN01_07120 [Cupriavidus sp. SHE]QBP09985.1 type II secretion system protein GspI [Cupriavidus metallidurans]